MYQFSFSQVYMSSPALDAANALCAGCMTQESASGHLALGRAV